MKFCLVDFERTLFLCKCRPTKHPFNRKETLQGFTGEDVKKVSNKMGEKEVFGEGLSKE